MYRKLSFITLCMIFYMSHAYAEEDLCAQVMKMDIIKIKEIIQRESVTNYLSTMGSCPCPYSYDSVYSRYCGITSAYTKNRVKLLNFPKCYPEDITGVDIANFRENVCKAQKEQDEQKINNNENTIDTPEN